MTMNLNITEIVTHSGVFHADDVFACAVLKVVFPGAQIIRTRDPKLTQPAEGRLIVDVGGKYNPSELMFDHHQREGALEPRTSGIRYSGFGLVWKHFGISFIHALCPTLNVEMLQLVWAIVDESFVSAIDATDNGQRTVEPAPGFEDFKGFGLAKTISCFNPSWGSKESPDAAFSAALALASVILEQVVLSTQSSVTASVVVAKAIEMSKPSPILLLPDGMPWEDVATSEVGTHLLYVVYPTTEGTWMCQCIPPKAGSFKKRKPLPEAWAGLRDDVFAKESGVEDGIFCHPGRFICGAKSKEGAMRLAQLALEA